MAHFLIRFNKSRGAPGRGTMDHAWRVFEDGKEYLVKNVKINVESQSERTNDDWNIACDGILEIDRVNSVAIINKG